MDIGGASDGDRLDGIGQRIVSPMCLGNFVRFTFFFFFSGTMGGADITMFVSSLVSFISLFFLFLFLNLLVELSFFTFINHHTTCQNATFDILQGTILRILLELGRSLKGFPQLMRLSQ